jgi:hypothetical protein
MRELGLLLGVHRVTAHRWVVQGKFGAWVRLPDGSPRIAIVSLQAWIKLHTYRGEAPVLFFEIEKKEGESKRERSNKG